MTVFVCHKNWESSSWGYIFSRSSTAEHDSSTICFVPVWRPVLVPVRDTIKEAFHVTWFLPQLGISVDTAAGPTEEIAAQREQPVLRYHHGCLWLGSGASLPPHEALSSASTESLCLPVASGDPSSHFSLSTFRLFYPSFAWRRSHEVLGGRMYE